MTPAQIHAKSYTFSGTVRTEEPASSIQHLSEFIGGEPSFTSGASRRAVAYVARGGCQHVPRCGINLYDAYANNPPVHRSIKAIPLALCLDRKGTLYATGYGFIHVYPHGATHPSRKITGQELQIVRACAIDRKNNIWVATVPLSGNGPAAVFEFPEGSNLPKAQLTSITYPFGLAFDSNENLYVADQAQGRLCVFPPGHLSPSECFSSGNDQPSTIAFDKYDTLYVTNYGGLHCTLVEFKAGARSPTLTIAAPNDDRSEFLTVTREGRLYWGLENQNYFAEYARGSKKPLGAVISQGLQYIFGIAIDELT